MRPRNPIEVLAKHKGRQVVIDSNLLLLLLVGSWDKKSIQSGRRTSSFTSDDFTLLLKLLKVFSGIITTPNILTEVCNLAGYEKGHIKEAIYGIIRKEVRTYAESYVDSKTATCEDCFGKLGLTDAVLLHCAKDGHLIVTTDFDLFTQIVGSGFDAVNFNHLRTELLLGIA